MQCSESARSESIRLTPSLRLGKQLLFKIAPLSVKHAGLMHSADLVFDLRCLRSAALVARSYTTMTEEKMEGSALPTKGGGTRGEGWFVGIDENM